MGKHLLKQAVDTWMSDSFMDPWKRYLETKQARGEVVKVGNVHVDAVNMFQRPFVCDSHVCSPGLRKRGKQSCCGELEAAVTPEELKGVEKHFHLIDQVLRREDPSWARKPRTLDECTEIQEFNLMLRKRGGRCVFSYPGGDGELLCAVHTAAMEAGLDLFKVKPKLCSIFPLVLQDMLDGTYMLSKLDEENGALIGFSSYNELPCLHGKKTYGADGPPTYQDFVGTLSSIFSPRFVQDLDVAARAWRKERGLATPPLRRLPVL
ncbi:MAG: DUF3109 family protein [Myxococcota bacterium]